MVFRRCERSTYDEQFYNQDEEVQKAVKAMFDFIEAMNKLDSKHQQQVLNEGIKAEMLKSILKMQ